MLEFILARANMPFAVALGVMAGIVLLELVSMLLGFALSHGVDHGLGLDSIGPDLDLNADGEVSAGEHVLGWLNVGHVPALVLFVLFLAGFGVTGLLTQSAAANLTRQPLNVWLASAVAFFGGLGVLKVAGGVARKHVFREDSSAVSSDSLLGHPATIVLGATRRGHPTQAKLQDQHGQTHYVLVEPLEDEGEFQSGETVMLVERKGPKYFVIENSADALFRLGSQAPVTESRQSRNQNARS